MVHFISVSEHSSSVQYKFFKKCETGADHWVSIGIVGREFDKKEMK